jgi:hypothetical protein
MHSTAAAVLLRSHSFTCPCRRLNIIISRWQWWARRVQAAARRLLWTRGLPPLQLLRIMV